jgi:hypothetical protein
MHRQFDRVAVAAVYADLPIQARPKAKSTFKRRAERWGTPTDRGDRTVELVADVDEHAEVNADIDLEQLPEHTAENQPASDRVLDIVDELTVWADEAETEDLLAMHADPNTCVQPRLFGPNGEAITSKQELDALLNDEFQPVHARSDKLWFVPGLLFEIEYDGPKAYFSQLECPWCRTQTRHFFAGHEPDGPVIGHGHDEVPVWECTDCHNLKNAPEPGFH